MTGRAATEREWKGRLLQGDKEEGEEQSSQAYCLCGDIEARRSLREAKQGEPVGTQARAPQEEFLRKVTCVLAFSCVRSLRPHGL